MTGIGGNRLVTGLFGMLLLIAVQDVPLRVGASSEHLVQLVIGKLLCHFCGFANNLVLLLNGNWYYY